MAGFTIPVQKGVAYYSFNIAMGHILMQDSFQRQIIIVKKSNANKTLATLPYWQTNYTWQVVFYNNKQEQVGQTPLHHFTTGYTVFADTAKYRLRIIDSAKEHKELLFFSDCTRGIYNISGELVWFLPQITGVIDTTMPVRDLKLTPQGSVTFIANTKAYEISYNGALLWKAPDDGSVSGDTTEQYHHEVTRLSNGHYFIAGNQTIKKTVPGSLAESHAGNEHIKRDNVSYYSDVVYGTIIEYDNAKKIKWYWKAAEHLSDTLLFTSAMFQNGTLPGFHFNAFFIDETKKCIYASFRDIHKIVKIAYPSGNVLNIYDAVEGNAETQLLKGQHNCRINNNGDVYLFNNNVAANGPRQERQEPASVMILKEQAGSQKDLSVIWKFNCDIDNNASPNARGGGSVYELNNGSIFACMGTAARLFIVNKDKQIIWNAVTELKNGNRWLPQSNYRAYPIEEAKELEKMVFAGK